MIIAKNLKKTYTTKVKKGFMRNQKQTVEAVKGINLQLKKGQIIGLLGINGAGKTTTIKMISTLLEPTSGTVTIDGEDVIRDKYAIKHRVNMVAGGERMIYWRLTGRENLWYFGQLYGIDDKALKERIDHLIVLVGLEDKQHIPVERYSKGMKQRLQIARGLINDPCYLFMDEPTLGLDAPIAKEIRTYIKHLATEQEKGILLTSHYIHEVEELCDYIYVLHDGRVILEGTAEELSASTFESSHTILEFSRYDDYIQTKIVDYTDSKNFNLIMEANHYRIESSYDITDELVQMIHDDKLPIKKFYVEKPKLEDTIIEIARRAV